jgi:hypothetical protein
MLQSQAQSDSGSRTSFVLSARSIQHDLTGSVLVLRKDSRLVAQVQM